jgi:hypothetical protein
MVVLELDEVEIDNCLECGGIWLDAGELELLIEDEKEKDLLLTSFKVDSRTKEKPIKCPMCSKKMEKILYGNENNKDVLVDKCKFNHGIWFDSGELQSLARMSSTHHSKKVLNLLNDMFGHKLKS